MIRPCETYSSKCANWDNQQPITEKTYSFAGKYPKRKRISMPLVVVRLKSSYLLMCSPCKQEFLDRYPELRQFDKRGGRIALEGPENETSEPISTES